MSTHDRTIVVAVDGSDESEAAVVWAAREATMRQASVTLLHVITPMVTTWLVEPVAFNVPEWFEEQAVAILANARKVLEAHLDPTSHAPLVDEIVVRDTTVAALEEASRNARLVVVGCRGLGAFGRVILGSTSTGLVRHAHCPVAVVHRHAEDEAVASMRPVLLGIDGSPVSEAATAMAFDEASRRDVDLIALHAWSDVGVFPAFKDWHEVRVRADEVLAERLAGWQERYPDVNIERRVVCDTPAKWLTEASEHAQLVVVGARGRGGFPGLRLGSVASSVAQHSAVPVIVVPSS